MAPRKRFSHVSAIMGGLMIVHGGKNSEVKQVLSDFNIFDLGVNEWLPIIINVGKLNEKHQFL